VILLNKIDKEINDLRGLFFGFTTT